MKKTLLYTVALVAGLCSCTEDYKDWAAPQSNAAGDAVQKLELSIQQSTATIDFANYTDESVQLFTTNLTAAQAASYTVDLTGEGASTATSMQADAEGKVLTADLIDAVKTMYGASPTERTLNVVVSTVATNETAEGNIRVKREAAPFTLKAKLNAPFIDTAYYLTGDFAGWNKDGALAFTHIGDIENIYDNPEFQIVFTTTADNQYWKIISKTNYDNDFWAGGTTGVVGTKVDGDTSVEGLLTTDNPQAGKIEAAGIYRMTINMMEYTYKIEKLNFTEFIYVPGNAQGWSPASAAALRSPNFDGVYIGYAVLDGGFKFTKERNWDNGEYNWSNFNTVSDVLNNGAGTDTNIYCDNAGLYFLKVDVASGKIEATKITNMNLVGDFNGWNQADDAQRMTWDAENLCFSITGAGVTANGWKFTANNDWAINLGGSIDDLIGDGGNLSVVGTTIKLYPCRTTSDKIYCTVE